MLAGNLSRYHRTLGTQSLPPGPERRLSSAFGTAFAFLG